MATGPARVFLVDRDVAIRTRMRRLLDGFMHLEVVGEAGGPDDARGPLLAASAHVVVVSGRPEADAVEICRLVRDEHREVALLVRTSAVDDELLRVIRGGFYELVSEEARAVDFLRALDLVVERRAAGLTWPGPLDEADQRLLERLPPTQAGMLQVLTPPERRILELRVEGLDVVQISEQLFLAQRTVRTHLDSIGRKLGWTDQP